MRVVVAAVRLVTARRLVDHDSFTYQEKCSHSCAAGTANTDCPGINACNGMNVCKCQ